ncbi:MAG: protein-disulfide reductase DsbD family protein [Phycisphaerales bacterium]|nr:protein-disulfide reductase DsbD family protein [Phycisphaerales bacterium]
MQLATILLLAIGQLPGQSIPAPEVAPDIKMHVEGPVAHESGVFMLAQGYENHLLCTLEIPSGFHVYWSNPGASGSATNIQVTAPASCTVGDTLYPRPEVFHGPEGDTYGYEDRVTFLVPITSPAIEVFNVEVKANWLACRKACYMGRSSREIKLSVVGHVTPASTPALEMAMKSLPSPLGERVGTESVLEPDRLTITGPIGKDEAISFIPGHVLGVVLGDAQIERDETHFILVVPYMTQPRDALGVEPRIHGLLCFGTGRMDPSFEITMPLSHSAETEPNTD